MTPDAQVSLNQIHSIYRCEKLSQEFFTPPGQLSSTAITEGVTSQQNICKQMQINVRFGAGIRAVET